DRFVGDVEREEEAQAGRRLDRRTQAQPPRGRLACGAGGHTDRGVRDGGADRDRCRGRRDGLSFEGRFVEDHRGPVPAQRRIHRRTEGGPARRRGRGRSSRHRARPVKRFFAWGNRLHNGESSIPFVGKAKLWLTIAGALVILSLLVPLFAGFNFGIAFKGGSQFQIDQVTDTSAPKGEDIVNDAVSGAEPRLTPTSDTAVQIETNQLSDDEMQQVRDALVSGYDVPKEDVTSTFVGPEWGQDVTEKMVRALVIFVAI